MGLTPPSSLSLSPLCLSWEQIFTMFERNADSFLNKFTYMCKQVVHGENL